jgi:hypothetical protein
MKVVPIGSFQPFAMFSTTKSAGGAASVVEQVSAPAAIATEGARADESLDENPDANPDASLDENCAKRWVRTLRA